MIEGERETILTQKENEEVTRGPLKKGISVRRPGDHRQTVGSGSRKLTANLRKWGGGLANMHIFVRAPDGVAPTQNSGSGRLFLRSFIVCVLAPTLIAFFYYCTWASDVYVAETKITVRAADYKDDIGQASSILGKIGLSGAVGTAQDSLMVLDYLKSRAAVIDAGGRSMMASMFDQPDVDWFSRLDSTSDFEELWSYWRDHVLVNIDTPSSILTVRVYAYSPERSLKLANEVVRQSELLINRVSMRSRHDALERAEGEVGRAADKLAKVRAELLSFQQQTGSIDPIETAKRIVSLISALTIQKVELENEIATSNVAGVAGRPGERQLKVRLSVLNEQIKELQDTLTGQTSSNSVSAQLKGFELLKLQEEFEEQIYTFARTSYEQARRRLDRQQLYLAVVVPPMLPERALYPRPFVDSALVFATAFVFWAILSLVAASVRDSVG